MRSKWADLVDPYIFVSRRLASWLCLNMEITDEIYTNLVLYAAHAVPPKAVHSSPQFTYLSYICTHNEADIAAH